MMPDKIRRMGTAEIKSKIETLCTGRPDIAAVFLFGSYGTCYQTKFSDIDFGVLFFRDTVPDLRGEMELAALFSLHLKREDVDLVIMNKAPLPLRYKIIAEGELIYEKDYFFTSDFLAHTCKMYLDYSIDYNYMMNEYARSLKEAYGDG